MMGEGGEKTKKIMHGGITEKKIVQRRSEGKRSAESFALSRSQTVFASEANWQPLYTTVCQ